MDMKKTIPYHQKHLKAISFWECQTESQFTVKLWNIWKLFLRLMTEKWIFKINKLLREKGYPIPVQMMEF